MQMRRLLFSSSLFRSGRGGGGCAGAGSQCRRLGSTTPSATLSKVVATSSIDCVVTMGTIEVVDEINLFLASLSATEGRHRVSAGKPPLRVVVGATSELIEKQVGGTSSSSSSSHRQLEVGLDVQYLACLDAYLPASKSGSSTRKNEDGDLDGQRLRLDRATMERTPGRFYPTLHCDFMMEKATLLEYALGTHGQYLQGLHRSQPLIVKATEAEEGGSSHQSTNYPNNNVLFMDCDIVTLAPLPKAPSAAAVGLCRHHIRSQDEQLFGHYNGGWVYLNAQPCSSGDGSTGGCSSTASSATAFTGTSGVDCSLATSLLYQWRKATHSSRYFDQASLEDVARYALETKHHQHSNSSTHSVDAAVEVFHQFSQSSNFGYWRMFQADRPATLVAADFDLAQRQDDKYEVSTTTSSSPSSSSAPAPTSPHDFLIHYQGSPLQSIHTHFHMPWADTKTMPLFNRCIKRWMTLCIEKSGGGGAYPPVGGLPGSAGHHSASNPPHPYALILPFL